MRDKGGGGSTLQLGAAVLFLFVLAGIAKGVV